jgi:hypothetical protein
MTHLRRKYYGRITVLSEHADTGVLVLGVPTARFQVIKVVIIILKNASFYAGNLGQIGGQESRGVLPGSVTV